jgi:hypothetical protein
MANSRSFDIVRKVLRVPNSTDESTSTCRTECSVMCLHKVCLSVANVISDAVELGIPNCAPRLSHDYYLELTYAVTINAAANMVV